jgi:ubiquinone/menaquinone biosynthesis C-methylase UbiE
VDRKEHWDDVYRAKAPDQLTWFQPRPETSLRLIEEANVGPEARIIDVGGGTSSLTENLLEAGYHQLTVLDVSGAALEVCRQRLAGRAADVEWIEADLTCFEPSRPWDLWHDRAVLHFLTDPEDVRAYRKSMLRALAENGQAVIATFGPQGPKRCSGLDVQRYGADSLSEAVGPEMELVESRLDDHVTPTGASQQFLFCRFRRL